MGSMYHEHDRIIKKIPGVPQPSPKEKQGYIDDISKKSKVEILELIERQDKLLQNQNFIRKLPDKGARICQFREKLLHELKERDKVDEACSILSSLSLNNKAHNPSDVFEWTGHFSKDKNKISEDENIEDDDTDVFKILASNAGIGTRKKTHRVEKPEKPLIKPEDLEDVNPSTSSGSTIPDPYVEALCHKFDKPQEARKQFKPHRSLKTRPERTCKPHNPYWEVTAATPPPPVYGDTKLVSLQESLKLQVEQTKHLKEIQTVHAAERLMTKLGMKIGDLPQKESLRTAFRTVVSPSDSDDESEDSRSGVLNVDDEDEERETDVAVIYSLTDT